MAFYGTDVNDVQFNNTNFTQYGGDGNDSLGRSDASFRAYGGNGDDTLFQNGNFYIDAWGGYGNDWITLTSASSAASYLYGDEGSDIINGSAGFDYIEGGQDNDGLYGNGGDDVIYGGDGDDSSVTMITAGTGVVGYTTTMAGGLYGGAGNDYLDGGRGDDILYGGADNDTMYGGEGNDTLIGQSGADIMYGGAGSDIYDVDNNSDYVGEAQNSGDDTVYTSVTFALTANVENLVLLGSVREGGGNELNNSITGNAADNVITGAAGYDALTGGGGNDVFVLRPGFGVDYISDFIGGAGASDTIYAAVSLFSSFADVIAHSVQQGVDAVINDGIGDTLVLHNVNVASLAADDFYFF